MSAKLCGHIHPGLIETTTEVTVGIPGDGSYILPPATETVLGGIKVGDNLTITSDGRLSVVTASMVEDNTLPVTAAAVHTELGNVEALLGAL